MVILKKVLKQWILCFLPLFFLACGEGTSRVIPVPKVSVECSSASSNRCVGAADGALARVYLTRSGCSNPLFEPVGTSVESLRCNALGCEAFFSNWVDSDENQVNEILSGSISVCVLLDFNSNLQEDSGELNHILNTIVNAQTTFTIDSWSEI